jgi:hypothetical protein
MQQPKAVETHTLVKSFEELTPEERAFVLKEAENVAHTKEREEAFKKTYSLLGIKQNGRLVSFISYQKRGRECLVNRIWGKTSISFVRTFKTTPALFLIEELIRRKTRVILSNGFTRDGTKLFEGLERKKLVKRTTTGRLLFGHKTTKEWVKTATNRQARIH